MSKLWEVACRNICVSDDIGMGRSSQVEARIKVVGEASFPFSPSLLLFRICAVVIWVVLRKLSLQGVLPSYYTN